ncbi:hypothetical protein SAMN05216297_101137 [Flavobacterium phragmitis]|uniref:Uncharacterized protein n=1 Tax=Flavobacterium phragmitis TaxID=739143 RepID=A0A1I1JXK7_9FLAO|nr:hypothetical protein SAMN05216297_101137 [Flavobacterium phragmitis]
MQIDKICLKKNIAEGSKIENRIFQIIYYRTDVILFEN